MTTDNGPEENAAWLAQLKGGDQAAFSALVRRHHRALIALARAMVGENDAEEMVQRAWLKAYGAVASFEGRASLRTWLSRIVINEGRMWLRKQGREVSLESLPETVDPLAARFDQRGLWSAPPAPWHSDSPEGLLMTAQLADCLERLLTGMPGNQRALLEMRDTDGLPFDEICNLLGLSASNARVLLHRARARLFGLVDHYQETGEC
ncbi:rna polymerase sigma-e factor [Alcanivorax sp. S71-1-4]|jgi:RNA polymerase sigma-70 factor, ECF subfamily|uniref:RNA polymerase sigma factor n=1 Tax=Alcanivorax sp. S71-1-4 TaxID=1177159 RepID=UPI00135A67B8|nr:sigma-70 family RNA polymerase sigma factor [Alcanivorax sp. S71-1-4]KAF0810264.1 rna polymerase sigma-e factor [Alcanivorax sp. S71-1-4]